MGVVYLGGVDGMGSGGRTRDCGDGKRRRPRGKRPAVAAAIDREGAKNERGDAAAQTAALDGLAGADRRERD